MSEVGTAVWRFGDAEFDEGRWSLRVAGQAVALEPKPLKILALLLRRPGEVVTRDELLAALWPGTSVVDKAVTNAVGKLRQALGPGGPAAIVTVPKVGYRLVPAVQRSQRSAPDAAVADVPAAMAAAALGPDALAHAAASAPTPACAPAIRRGSAPWRRRSATVWLASGLALAVTLGLAAAWQAHDTREAAQAERRATQALIHSLQQDLLAADGPQDGAPLRTALHDAMLRAQADMDEPLVGHAPIEATLDRLLSVDPSLQTSASRRRALAQRLLQPTPPGVPGGEAPLRSTARPLAARGAGARSL